VWKNVDERKYQMKKTKNANKFDIELSFSMVGMF